MRAPSFPMIASLAKRRRAQNQRKFRRLVAAADRHRGVGDWPNAAANYRDALKAMPESAPIWVQFGHALKEQGHYQQAEAAYRIALALHSDEADTHVQLGHALKLQGRHDDAFQAYAAALKLDPNLEHASRELQALTAAGETTPSPEEELRRDLARLSNGFEQIGRRLEFLSDEFSKVLWRNERLQLTIDSELRNTQQIIKSELNELRSDNASQQEQIAELAGADLRHEQRVGELAADFFGLRRDHNEITSQLADNSAAAGRHGQQISSLVADVKELGLLFPNQPTGSDPTWLRNLARSLPKEPVRRCIVCDGTEFARLGEKEAFTVWRCSACGFMFPNPRVARTHLKILYGSKYWNEHQLANGLATISDRAGFDYHHALARVFLVRKYKQGGRWLDVGCAHGAVVRRAKEFGYDSEGLEIDPQIAKFGSSYFDAKITVGEIETANLNGEFDIISMYDVFEHLYDPDKALSCVNRRLHSDGVLIVETFRTDLAAYESDPLSHPDCKPLEHVAMYREEHLNQVLGRNGFYVEATHYPRGPDNARVLLVAQKL
jgi:tetratricopeptide (TPR) repeat protein